MFVAVKLKTGAGFLKLNLVALGVDVAGKGLVNQGPAHPVNPAA